MNIKVTKASGIVEDFAPEKLRASLIKAGAGSGQVEEIIKRVLQDVGPYTNTKRIYRLAKKYLRKFNHSSELRYSLKNAIFRLGPTGYPFEKYYGAVLKDYGYETETGLVMQGKCINHEIDVLARNENEISLVECKYHSRPGIAVDVKIAMYVHSRFKDLEPVMASQYPDKKFKGWLVTNTRFTTDAIKFAQCYGLNMKSWSYPGKDNFGQMVADKRLYPVTIISGIQKGLIHRLVEHNIILLKDLTTMKINDIQKMLSLPERKARTLKRQAEDLCMCP